MKILEDRIRKDGKLAAGDVLRVDSFINHRIDCELMQELAAEICRRFADTEIDKVVTVEASGIAFGAFVAAAMKRPLVFAKKKVTSNLANDIYKAEVASYTQGQMVPIVISKEFLKEGEKILLLDDFLARGEAMCGLLRIMREAGCEVVGVGIIIEKAFQPGRGLLEAKGLRVESLARIASMTETSIEFVPDID